MIYSKVENNQVFFRLSDENGDDDWNEITEITKEDILELLTFFKNDDDFKLAEYHEESIRNPAHQIIYKEIYQKFNGLQYKKDSLNDSSNNRYQEAINKYS